MQVDQSEVAKPQVKQALEKPLELVSVKAENLKMIWKTLNQWK
jgi:hypothetical protein